MNQDDTGGRKRAWDEWEKKEKERGSKDGDKIIWNVCRV